MRPNWLGGRIYCCYCYCLGLGSRSFAAQTSRLLERVFEALAERRELARLGGDGLVGGVGQVPGKPLPLDQAHSDPGVLTHVASSLLHNHEEKLILITSSEHLKTT